MKRREFIGLIGVAAVSPLAARAQQPARMKRIAMVHPSNKVDDLTINGRYNAFFAELIRLGYVEGQNLTVERYSGEGRTESYAELARHVVSANPDLIFAIQGGTKRTRRDVCLESAIGGKAEVGLRGRQGSF